MKNRDLLLLVLAMVCASCGTPLASSSAGDSIQDLKELFNKANFSVDYLEEMGINEAQGKASQNPKGRRPSFLNDDSQSWLLKYRTSGEWHSLTMEKNERQHDWEEVMYRGFHSDSEFSFNITFGDNVMGMGHLKSECPLGQDDGEGNILLPAGDYDFYVASYTDDFAPHRDRIWISEASEEEDPEPEPSSIINYVYDKSEVYAEDTENRIFILGADGSKRTYMSSMWPGDNRACSNIVAKEGDRISIGMEEYPARAAFITEEGLDSNWQHNSYYHTFEEAGTYDVFIFNSFDSRDPKQVFISRQKQEPLDLSDDALNRLTKVTPQESEPFTIASQLNEYQDSVVKVTDGIRSGTKEAIEAADGLGEIEVKGRKVTLSMENGIGKASYTIPNNGDYCVMLKENEVLLTVDWTKTLEIPEEYSNAPWLNESMLRTSIHIVRENGEMKRFTHFGPNGNFWEEGEWGFYYIDLTKTERGTEGIYANAGSSGLWVRNMLYSKDYCYSSSYYSGYGIMDPFSTEEGLNIFEPDTAELSYDGQLVFTYDSTFCELALGTVAIDGIEGFYYDDYDLNDNSGFPLEFPSEIELMNPEKKDYFKNDYKIMLNRNGKRFKYVKNKDGQVFPGVLSTNLFWTGLYEYDYQPKCSPRLAGCVGFDMDGKSLYEYANELLQPYGMSVSTKMSQGISDVLRNMKPIDVLNEKMDYPIEDGMILKYAKMIDESHGKQIFPSFKMTL